ncbi:MAG: WhiB family transcriptional regulator [Labedaea sp.]
MSTATVPLTRGAPPDLLGPLWTGVSDLLDSAPSAGLDLPCRSSDNPDLWFADTPADLERAKVLCLDCPVRSECLSGALARQEPWGVWGGEIFERGAVIARKRPRGRPRKEDVAHEAAGRAARAQEAAA